MIKSDWEGLRWTNSPRDIFIRFAHYFQLNLDETSFLCNEGGLNVVGVKEKPQHETYFSDSIFSIIVLQIGSETVVNGWVVLLEKGTLLHFRIRSTNLVTWYGFSKGSCVIPKKLEYMDDKTWAKVVKVVAPAIRKMKVSNVACVWIFYFIYLYLQIICRW